MAQHDGITARFDKDRLRRFVDCWAKECGTKVRDRRNEIGLTLATVAAIAGSTVQSIQRVEKGRLVPTDELRIGIASALRCEVADLWPAPTTDRALEAAEAVAA